MIIQEDFEDLNCRLILFETISVATNLSVELVQFLTHRDDIARVDHV